MHYYGTTNIGSVRKSNQDAFGIEEFGDDLLAVVCDGVGGNAGGEIASRIAIDTITSYITSASKSFDFAGIIINALLESVSAANRAVLEYGKNNPRFSGLGTTVVAAYVRGRTAYITHVGDSRAYIFEKNVLELITKDHSYIQNMIESGQITEEEARVHPNRNIITRSLGMHEFREAECKIIDMSKGSALLLCTDGLSNMVEEKDIARLVNIQKLEKSAEAMTKLAIENGGYDNITVVLLTP